MCATRHASFLFGGHSCPGQRARAGHRVTGFQVIEGGLLHVGEERRVEPVYKVAPPNHEAKLHYLLCVEMPRQLIVDFLVYGYRSRGDLRVTYDSRFGFTIDAFWERIVTEMI